MRIKCARCGKSFDREVEHHLLCREDVSGCWEVVGLYGDPDAIRFWRMASTWVNGIWPDEWVKELADSPVGQNLLKALLREMDYDSKIKLLKQTLAKM